MSVCIFKQPHPSNFNSLTKNRDWTIRRNRLQSGIKIMGICCWRFYPKKVNPQLLKKFSFSWAFLTTQGWFIMSCKEGLSLALETRILEIRSAASGLTNSGIEYWNGNHNYFKISTIKHIQDIKEILHDNQGISYREPWIFPNVHAICCF